VGFEFARGIGGGWVVGYQLFGYQQKLITVLGRFDTYKGGVQVYEAYEVKKSGGKLRCLLLRRQKICFFIFMKSLRGKILKNGPLYTTNKTGHGC